VSTVDTDEQAGWVCTWLRREKFPPLRWIKLRSYIV